MTFRRVPAYAKINLSLRVLGKREDGYHELDTYFLQVDWCDELTFKRTELPGMELTCNWEKLPTDHTNLCRRAYDLITQKFAQKPGVSLHLEKHIPMGAGLGGGSSDAAVTLAVLNELFEAGFSDAELMQMAGKLGADVPFFLLGGFCHGSGRGEILTPISNLPELYALIVTPGIALPTATVYQNLKIGLTRRAKCTIFAGLNHDVKKFYELYPGGQNDLEPVVFEKYLLLRRVKRTLLEQGAWGASMTGSGSAVFGLFSTKTAALKAQRAFDPEDYATFVARPVKWGLTEISQA